MGMTEVESGLQGAQILDGMPNEYRPETVHPAPDVGAVGTLREYYEKNLVAVDGRLVIGQAVITTSPEVMAILRALLYTGCCRLEERSMACREIFMRACKGGLYLGAAELLQTFVQDSDNRFIPILQDAIRNILEERHG